MKSAFKRLVSGLLAAVMAFQPVLLRAGEIVHVKPDTARPRVDRAHNGTTILNIDTPNAAGVSHDQYQKFSADDLIVNNSPTNVTTELGGWIEGNPNLKPANPAKLWIGEVVGGSAAELKGMLEVGGPSLDVVLANEYGITCDGCGFINTGRATLTTGTPKLSAAGSLDHFDVRRGTVTITGAGLNPESRVGMSDTGRVDVIARAAEIYGRMRAKGLNVVAGANAVKYDWSYDPATGKVTGVTPQSGTGPAPALAVDVSALGGMYADAIKMIATESGVGMRIDGEMASGSNLSLSSAGRLSLGPSSGAGLKAKQKVRVRSAGPLLLEGSVTSEQGDLVEIRSGDTLTFTGQASGGNVLLESAGAANIAAAVAARGALALRATAGSLTVAANAALSARNAVIAASGNLTVNGNLDAEEAAELVAGETLAAGAGAKVSAGSLRLGGTAIATEGLFKSAGTLGLRRSGEQGRTQR